MASRLQDVIARGLASAKPLATTVAPGTLYYSTDTKVTERSDGTTWEDYSDGGTITSIPVVRRQITVVIDGGGTVITTGLKAFLSIPIACTIKKWRILSIDSAATAGFIVIDIWKDIYTNYPPALADSIIGGGGTKPTLSGVNKNESIVLTGWTVGINAGDILGFNVDSATTVTKVQLVLEVE